MRVRIELMAQLRAAAGASAIHVEIPDGATAQEAVRRVAIDGGGRLAEMLLDADGRLQRTVLAAAGGRQVLWDEPCLLSEGDVIVLATPLGGG